MKLLTFLLIPMSMLVLLMNTQVAYSSNVASAHIASPEHYQILLENEHVLVLKMTLKPGESDKWHKHNAETVYFEQGGKATITTKDGANTLDIPSGFTMWHDAWEHQVANVGSTTITAIIVERK